MKNLLLIKIGGGVITDKKVRYGLKADILRQIVKEIAEGYKKLNNTDLIVGNGAGSFAHFSAAKYRTAEGFVDEQSPLGLGWVRYDAVKLSQIVLEELLNAGLPAYSISPSSMMSVDNGETKNIFLDTMKEALVKGLVPLVYGDAMIDETKGSCIYSTEKVFDELSVGLRGTYEQVRVIHVSSEDGVLVDGKVFSEITSNNIELIKHELAGSGGVDVTGGMLHKVRECLEIAKMGIESMIISGLVPGRVNQAIIGETVVGTKICL